jgi:hypothetical protein
MAAQRQRQAAGVATMAAVRKAIEKVRVDPRSMGRKTQVNLPSFGSSRSALLQKFRGGSEI